jgi:hypothetical protein
MPTSPKPTLSRPVCGPVAASDSSDAGGGDTVVGALGGVTVAGADGARSKSMPVTAVVVVRTENVTVVGPDTTKPGGDR